MTRHWREQDHPRDSEGQFREKWAGRISDSIGLPSLRDLLARPDADYPEVAAQLEGRYGSGGMIVKDVAVTRFGSDYHDAFRPVHGGHVNISGEIASDADPSNAEGGYFRLTAAHGPADVGGTPTWHAHLDRMHVRGGAQGGGGGRELTDRLVGWLRQSGFDEVTVGPSEIGSYAWGAMGFDFGSHEDRRIAWEGAMTMTVESVRTALDPKWNQDLPPLPDDAAIKRMIRQYKRAATLALAGGMSYQRLSQVGRRKGQGKNDWWAGKLGLIVGGTGSGRIKL